MKEQLFIPAKIKVGYQERSDTYTKRLGYVIYYDIKNVLRKEKSWRGWIKPSLGTPDFDNKPAEGFVLNKDAGGKRGSWSSWNTRMEKVRVFDPRGFEFEITIPNLLYILQECSSVKGKGLEGEFVYAWDGPELILLPVKSEEYQKCKTFTDIQSNKVSSKEIIEGHSYMTKKQETVIYMGKHDWTTSKYVRVEKQDRYGRIIYDYKSQVSTKLMHIFWNDTTKDFFAATGFTNIASKVSDLVSDYAEKMDKLQESPHISIPDRLELKDKVFKIKPYDPNNYTTQYISDEYGYEQKKGQIIQHSIRRHIEYKNGKSVETGLSNSSDNIITLNNSILSSEKTDDFYKGHNNGTRLTLDQLNALGLKELYIVMKNGKKIKYSNYKL